MLIGGGAVFNSEEIFHSGFEDLLFFGQWTKVASIQHVTKYPMQADT